MAEDHDLAAYSHDVLSRKGVETCVLEMGTSARFSRRRPPTKALRPHFAFNRKTNSPKQTGKTPPYGERLARHWLDLVRFGETHGFETNRERAFAWRFRDYVIQSFNAAKPIRNLGRPEGISRASLDPLRTHVLKACRGNRSRYCVALGFVKNL